MIHEAPTAFLRTARAVLSALLNPKIFLPLSLAIFTTCSLLALQRTIRDPRERAKMTGADSKNYLQYARTFAEGDLSMSYARTRPHRQPLYPLLLAPIYKFAGRNLFLLGTVNMALAILFVTLVYLCLLASSSSRSIAALIAGCMMANNALFEQVTGRLLTEPLHFLLIGGAIILLQLYLVAGRMIYLLALGGTLGLSYLNRPNGLMIMGAVAAVLGLNEILSVLRSQDRQQSLLLFCKKIPLYLAVLLLFLFCSLPSLAPRWKYFGNPFHHGYLSNYLWVDSHDAAHTGDPFAIFHWQDYAESHRAGDAAQRMFYGVNALFTELPDKTEGWPVLFVLACAGFLFSLYYGGYISRMIALLAVLQLLPLLWTCLPNSSIRLLWGGFFPFEIYFAAQCLLTIKTRKWLSFVWDEPQEVRCAIPLILAS